MGSTTPQPPSAYSDAYSTIDVMLHNQPKSHNVGMDDNYMMTDPRHPHLDPPLQSTQAQHQANHIPAAPLSPYPDFNLPYQNHAQEHGQGFESSIDGRLDSPQDTKGTFGHRARSSLSEKSGGRGSTAPGRGRPPSLGSAGYNGYQRRNGSIDDTEATSPTSSRSYGARGSDGSIARANTIGMEDGIGEDPNKDDKEKPPPWSELKTKAGKERKRLPLACIACRRKKIRCSGEKPACQHCLRSRIPCVYKVTTRKAAPRTDYMAMLDKRLKRMEERVIKIIPKEEINVASAIGRANVKPSPPGQAVKVSSTKKRQAAEAFGLDEWAQSGMNSAGATLARPPKGLDTDMNRLLTEGAESLPSTEIQEHLSEVFFDCIYGQTYHILHKPSFMRRLRAGGVPPVLILAVCAVAARFSTHPKVSSEPAFLRGESWAAPARDIALRRYDEPNITILTVLLILGLHEFGTCQGGRSWMLGGMAMRMAYALQLHRELDHDPLGRKNDKNAEFSFTDREIRRRTMWACFLMDRFNSSGTQRPTFANEENIKVQLPIKESHFQMEIPGPTENLDGEVPNPVSADGGQASNPKGNMGVAAYMIRLIAVWGRVIKHLNLGGKEEDPYPLWDPKSHFAELKKQVESFKESLPSSLQYSLENLKNHAAEKLANQFLFLHISYNQVILFMHRFAIPSTPGGRLPKEMPKQFINEAGPIAIEAANQISHLLNESSDHSVVAPFVGYCAFVSSTIHVWGIFSKSPKLEASSKRNLAHNVKYLSKMKKHWGMFHFMAENLKDIYRQYADAALRGPLTPGAGTQDGNIFQYGDWFNKYPHGVSGTDYEDPAAEIKRESGNDAALSQKSDLQSVEDFFNSLSRPARVEHQRKATKKHSKNSTHQDHPAIPIKPDLTPDPNNQFHHYHQHPQTPLLNLPISAHQQPHPLASSAFSQQLQSANPYPIHHTTFPHAYTSDHVLGLPQSANAGLLPHLDRHLVFGAYAGMDPTATTSGSTLDALTQSNHPSHNPNHTASSGISWDGELDFASAGIFAGGAEGDEYGIGELQSSAWFMPFNLHPPDIGEDGGEGLGLGFGAMGGYVGMDVSRADEGRGMGGMIGGGGQGT